MTIDVFSEAKTEMVKAPERLRVLIRGAVQGVGFRPFVFRLAAELGLKGWVSNSAAGVVIEAEGVHHELETFLKRLNEEKPPRAFIQSLESSFLDSVGYLRFEIRPSLGGNKQAFIMPDIATCSDCLNEIFNPENRRYFYPFTNCTHCGPRFSIIEALPYDRANTTMKKFVMCDACRAEYENPNDRRFHAEPNACPNCGPHLELWASNGNVRAFHGDALLQAAQMIRAGKIVAVKGIGGFHLIADGRSDRAVQMLRQRKHREEKPFALMYPNLAMIQEDCEVSPAEERLLLSPEAPIVLLKRRNTNRLVIARDECRGAIYGAQWREKPEGTMNRTPTDRLLLPRSQISELVAPRNPYLGVMLPYTPLHHLLTKELGFPVVATSGNLSEEPIVTDEREALVKLGSIADFFLIHNRPIVSHVDDSIVRVVAGRSMMLRRARGYAPLPVTLENQSPVTIGVGAYLKNTVSAAVGCDVFVSQHLGDLGNEETFHSFERALAGFQSLYGLKPETVVCDLHPDYPSAKFAETLGARVVKIQHHMAHVMSCIAENETPLPCLGVAWDGTGYGLDHTVWGGEFFTVTEGEIERVATFRPFMLPAGEQSVREPRRSALGLLYEFAGEPAFDMTYLKTLQAFSAPELAVLRKILLNRFGSPLTSSVGRLFDAVSSILGIRQTLHFEGQGAMELEFALEGVERDETYSIRNAELKSERMGERVNGGKGDVRQDIFSPILRFPHLPFHDQPTFVIDWSPMIFEIITDLELGVPVGVISAKFHNTLAETIVSVARRLSLERVVLSGGCFQNKYLTEQTISRLKRDGFLPYWHQRIPPNDGGISLGQIAAARYLNR